MESIAELLVMLFTGKSEDGRQGITPSWTDVSRKILLFRRGGRKSIRGTLETLGGTAGTFCGLGGEVASAKLLSNWGRRNSKECQECANQRQTRPSMYGREASATWLISNEQAQFFTGKSW